MVSKASEDFPEPERPVITVIAPRGISTFIFFKLWVRAPFTRSQSLPCLCSCSSFLLCFLCFSTKISCPWRGRYECILPHKKNGAFLFRNAPQRKLKCLGLRGRDLADGEEATAARPPTNPPAQAQVATGNAPAETRHAAADEHLADGTETDDWILPLLVRKLRPVCKQVLDPRRNPWIPRIGRLDARFGIVGLDVEVEMEFLPLQFLDTFTLHGKPLRIDVAVDPVIMAVSDHLLKRFRMVDGKQFGVGDRSRRR